MQRKGRVLVATVSTGLAWVLGLGMLFGCAGRAGSGDKEPETSLATTEDGGTAAADDQEEGDEEAETEDAGQEASPSADVAASGTISTDSFSFTIPQYWEGKVEYYTFTNEQGNEAAIIYLPGNTDAELAQLSLVPGEEPYTVGDIGRHMVGSVVDGNGNHVEVWTYNWPWLAANNTGPEVGDEQLAQLVDLSTGGLLSLDSLADESEETITGAENGFMAAELVPTVSFG